MTSTTPTNPEPFHDPGEIPETEKEADIQSISSGDFPSSPSVETTSSSLLPANTSTANLTFSIARVRKSSSHPPLITFGLYSDATTKPFPVLFAHQSHWTYKKSRQELSFYKGSPVPAKGTYIGGIDFHHWLLDASSAMKILIPRRDEKGGEGEGEEEIDIKKSGWSIYSYTFEFRGRKFVWRKTKEQKLLEMLKLECVDEESGEQWATYAAEKRWCRWNSASERAVGRFEICKEGVEEEMMEMLMMSFVAVQTNAQKRVLQGSQAGWGGGLGAAVLYTVGG